MQYSRGDQGAAVRNYQTILKKKGYYTGAIDGKFGPLTEKAVRAFQRDHGLKVDGIIGPKTKAALNGGGASGGGAFTFGGGLFDKVIGGILLYGIFKVLMKIF